MPSLSEKRDAPVQAMRKNGTNSCDRLSKENPQRNSGRSSSIRVMENNSGKQVSATTADKTCEKAMEQAKMCDEDDQHSSVTESDVDMYSEDTETNYCHSAAFGFQRKGFYEQHSKMTDMIDIVYNGRMHRFFTLDSRGISSWLPGSYAADAIKRELSFPKYKTKLLRTIIFCKKYNVYFTISNDFTLKVYNKDFHETCKMENRSMRSLLHLNFNPATDELISSGIAGTTVWKYVQAQRSAFNTIKPMANYELQMHAEYPNIGDTWCTKVELVTISQQIFYCTESDLTAYDAQDFRKMFTIQNAHNGTLTCIGYSAANRLLVTGGADCEVKVWGAAGGHICSFRGHSRIITSIVIHPYIPGLVFSSSFDGTIKIWSFHTMDLFHGISVFSEGINWMNLTDDGMIWCANSRKISVLKYNHVVSFWGHARCQIVKLEVLEHEGKTKRIMALGEDGSVRLFNQCKSNTSALCTVLPPPIVSLLDSVNDVTLSRFNHLFFVLLNPTKLWIYTAKTDPACRIAEWIIPDLLKEGVPSKEGSENVSSALTSIALRNFEDKKVMHRCTQIVSGKTTPSTCLCALAVFSENGFQYHTPVGICSARSRHLLLFGLDDGRIVFSDQKRRGLLYCELKVHKEAVVSIKHKPKQNWLVTHCNNPQNAVFQIWKLPELELLQTVCTPPLPTCCAVIDDLLVTGYNTGHVTMQHIRSDNSQDPKQNNSRPPEHRGEIISVKSCKKSGIFCSSSIDGVIKIWNLDKVLMSDVRLGERLSSCNFLNGKGDLVIGWKRHLFVIDHKTLGLPDTEDVSSEDFEEDSEIYEDPAIRYDSPLKAKSTTSDITMKKYLVPYGFVTDENNSDKKILDVQIKTSNLETVESESSEGTMPSVTDAYLSPPSSVSSYGIIDALFDLKTTDRISMRKYDAKDLVMPEFGYSPGTTPSESVTSCSEENDEYPEFVDEVVEEEVLDSPVDESYEPAWLKKEEPIDLQKKLTTGVLVAKAFKKMRKNKKNKVPDAIVEEEPMQKPKSRFAGAQFSARGLIKSDKNSSVAVEPTKEAQRRKSIARDDKPPFFQQAARRVVKKTRRSSTTSSQRRRLVPADVPLDPSLIKENLPDSGPSTVLEEQVLQKLRDVGLKMTPQAKPGSAAGRMQQTRTTSSHKKKPSSASFSGKSDIRVSSRLKRKYSKSASCRRNKSSGRSSHLLLSNTIADLPSQNQIFKELESKSRISQAPSAGDSTDTIARVTGVHLKYTYPAEFQLHNSELATNDSGDIALSERSLKLKELEDSAMSSATQSAKPAQGYVEDVNEIVAENEEQVPENTTHEKEKDVDLMDVKDLLRKCQGPPDDYNYSDEEDEYSIPNLLGYDFHAIYKKDGLQFDENWQNRMLEKYLLMKLQKKQRHEAAMSKRVFLEQEKKFRFISSQPDLVDKFNDSMLEDHDTLAQYLLNSSLMRGEDSSQDVPRNASSATLPPHSQSSRRPCSSSSNKHKSLFDGHSEKESNFRFSLRTKSPENGEELISHPMKRSQRSALSTATHGSSTNSIKTKSSFLIERPRSSTSIPGKTRYILIKPEKEKKPGGIENPSKLEEQLLQKRFPSQHSTIMKSLGRSASRSNLSDTHEEDRVLSSTEETTLDRSRSPSHLFLSSYRSDTDTYLCDKYGDTVSKPSEQYLKISQGWKSAFSDTYINPLDIVKRKSSKEKRRTIEINMRSIHA